MYGQTAVVVRSNNCLQHLYHHLLDVFLLIKLTFTHIHMEKLVMSWEVSYIINCQNIDMLHIPFWGGNDFSRALFSPKNDDFLCTLFSPENNDFSRTLFSPENNNFSFTSFLSDNNISSVVGSLSDVDLLFKFMFGNGCGISVGLIWQYHCRWSIPASFFYNYKMI